MDRTNKWDTYRVHRDREVIDRTLRKVIFKQSKGKPYEYSVNIIANLIQFFSLTYRFLAENNEKWKSFIEKFNDMEQVAEGFSFILGFVKQFDKEIPIIKFGVELD